MERFHIAQTTFLLGTIFFRILLVPVYNLVPMKIVLWAGCKVGLINRRPHCLVFYSCFQQFFLLKLHIFNLKIGTFSSAKKIFFSCNYFGLISNL